METTICTLSRENAVVPIVQVTIKGFQDSKTPPSPTDSWRYPGAVKSA